jgi:hypothetical protein
LRALAAALAYDETVFPARDIRGPPVKRARSRAGAYVYGNILVLAAIVATSHESIAPWTAVVIVVATSGTTFLANVAAHSIGQSIGRTDDEARLHLTQEARDAVPIASSGSIPAVFLALGAVSWLPPALSQLLAEAVVVLRLAATGIVMRRVSGQASPLAALWSGFTLAGIGVVIAALEALLTH